VGFFGYLEFGDQVKGSITLNLPAGNPWAHLLGLLFSTLSAMQPFCMFVSLHSPVTDWPQLFNCWWYLQSSYPMHCNCTFRWRSSGHIWSAGGLIIHDLPRYSTMCSGLLLYFWRVCW
jgi:hypothetical protein